MNREKHLDNQKENKKAKKLFIIIMIISMAVGGVLGFFSMEIADAFEGGNITVEAISQFFIKVMAIMAPYILWGMNCMVVGYTFFALKKGKEEFALWDMEDELAMERIESRLTRALTSSTNVLIVGYFFFSAHILAIVRDIYRSPILFIFTILGMLFHIIACVVVQQKLVDFVKEMNPEKKGSVYDVKFQDKWLDSCDEAEQHMIGKAAYKAYGKVNSLCMTLFLIFFFISLIFKTGLLPIAIVLGILLYSQFVYAKEAKKCEKEHRNRE